MTQDQLFQSQAFTSRQGLLGEQVALAFERKRLPEFLHGKIVHFKENEIALGYDILSFETSTSIIPDRYIEVKTFRGHPHFYWSENEIAAARKYTDHYYLYLINIGRINDAVYEPQIIPNPAALFDDKRLWSNKPYQYAFSLNADANIPSDWDNSTILIGCYNSYEHLNWILANNLYNVRTYRPTNSIQKSIHKTIGATVVESSTLYSKVPGSVYLTTEITKATYLLLYSIGAPRSYMLFKLLPFVKRTSRSELIALGYKEPHCKYYLLHHIAHQLPSFYIDLTQLLRETSPKDTTFVGTPLYLAGAQLRRYMHMCVDSDSIYQTSEHKANKIESINLPYLVWTPEQDDKLIRLYDSRVRFNEIAVVLHRSTGAIINRLRKLGKIKQKK